MTTPTPEAIEKVARSIAHRLDVLPPDAFDAARAAWRVLAPIAAAQAKAEALREAAADWRGLQRTDDHLLAQWLRARAATIEGKTK